MRPTEVVKFPAWLIVLRHWQMVEYRNALTLPSLVGVERYVSDMRGASARNDLRAVLDAARSCPLEHAGHFLIYHCPNVQTLVLTEVPHSRPPRSVISIPNPENSDHCRLAADLETPLPEGDVFEHLLDLLCTQFSDVIDRGHYSRHGLTFGPMSPADTERIERALKVGLLPRPAELSRWPFKTLM
jgi:hypothetical protein